MTTKARTENLGILGGLQTITQPGPHYVWPRITDAVRQAVLTQLDAGVVSLYKRQGVFAEFEDEFANYHGSKHALLTNSGTSALFGMFEGLGLGPGDEIIAPSYTFFATISPILYTGAVPVFVDCLPNGNIDPTDVIAKITDRTKAVIVTHMWGIPCDMDQLVEICRCYGLDLLEDCSHAHGASINAQKVGTFGTAAAFSLQGQKIITGGEGGILITDSQEFYNRALLQGHYNKRCRDEIDPDNPLYQFALTGFGLKLRAHPWAIAMALEQFTHLDEWIAQKSEYADWMTEAFCKYSFLHVPESRIGIQPAWYAYTMQFDESQSNSVTIEQFEQALLAEGLVEVDRPGSTRPNHNLPLFTCPHKAMPRLYTEPNPPRGDFSNAEKFYRQAIKLPAWAFADEAKWVDLYIQGIEKVALVVQNDPQLLIQQNK